MNQFGCRHAKDPNSPKSGTGGPSPNTVFTGCDGKTYKRTNDGGMYVTIGPFFYSWILVAHFSLLFSLSFFLSFLFLGGDSPDEIGQAHQKISNEPGTLSMANTGQPQSGGSQFFINVRHNSFLDWFDRSSSSAHPVFGKVRAFLDG
jgi:cyclophilin family peptidyl-prolyl cis-trans isomerase